jgi:hypothetical protein
MQRVVMLGFIYTKCWIYAHCAEFRHAECCYAGCCYAEWHGKCTLLQCATVLLSVYYLNAILVIVILQNAVASYESVFL